MKWTVSVPIVATIFSQLLTKNFYNTFEFVKVIVLNIVNPDTVKTAFLMTTALSSDMLIYGESFLIY